MKPKYVMSHNELRTLREEASMNRQMLSHVEKEGYGAGSAGSVLNKNAIAKQAKHLESLALKHTPEKLSGADRDKLAKRAQELRTQLKQGICSHNEMNNMKKNPGAPLKHLEWERRNGQTTSEYKQVMRRLEPDDPGAASIERLRK